MSLVIAVVLSAFCITPAFASDIDINAAEDLAIAFLSEIHHVEFAPETYKFDISPYTSVINFNIYMSLRMRQVRDLAKLEGGNDRFDSFVFEAGAVDYEDVDGGLLLTMHVKNESGEFDVYVLVAEGESGLEVRDFNYPHTAWDGIRGDGYVPKDVNYWINSPDIEAAIENAENYDEASPKTGIAFPSTMLLPALAIAYAAKKRDF